MSEGKNPVHVRGGENVTATHFTIEGPNESVLVFLDRASWDAMVERAARGHFEQSGLAIDSLGGQWQTWEGCTDTVRGAFRRSAVVSLRAALALPPEWEPEERNKNG